MYDFAIHVQLAKIVKNVVTFEKVIKTFLLLLSLFPLLLLSLRKSNQNASAVLKKLKN